MAAKQQPLSSASAPAAGVSMKEYLKRYQSGSAADGDQKKAKKKTKKKPKPAAVGGGVLIVDEDPVWQKPVQVEEDEPASSGDDRPQVDEDIEVKRMRRLEAIRAARPYNAIAEDGSGWVTVAASEEESGGPIRHQRNDTPSPERGGAGMKDLSPPRRRERRDTPSPERENVAGKDLSPSRQRQRQMRQDTPSPKGNDVAEQDDLSPPRRSRRQKDHSPPMRHSRHYSEEPQNLSPPRRHARHDSEEPQDLSPPRRRARHDSEEPKDLSPPRRRTRHDTEEPKDLSPPRRRKHQDSTNLDDLSPPRRQNFVRGTKHGDISPPRKGQKFASDDLSPPRKERDLSPPRKKGRKEGAPKEVRRAGLLTAEEVKEDIRKIKEDERLKFAAQDPSLVGKGAKAIFRDKEGRRITEEEMRKAKEPEKPKEIHIEWGKGLVQKREAEARLQELESEKSKPFARTRDDPELDSMLKNRIRWGDPMAHLVKRKDPEFLLEDLGDDEKMKESGFIVPQNIPNHSWLKRGVDPPPNRYGIKPGRHWDGVDRSNGFEKDMFKLKNEKQATEQEAYFWSVADM